VFIELSKVAHSVNNIRNLPLHCVRQACRPIVTVKTVDSRCVRSIIILSASYLHNLLQTENLVNTIAQMANNKTLRNVDASTPVDYNMVTKQPAYSSDGS